MENENLDNLIKEFLKPLFPEGEEDNQELQELIKALVSLMVLPDENFITIAPVFYESFEKTINEVDSQILLANIKKEGIEPEELIKTLINIADSIQSEQFNSISEIKKNFLTALLGIMCSAIERANNNSLKTKWLLCPKCTKNIPTIISVINNEQASIVLDCQCGSNQIMNIEDYLNFPIPSLSRECDTCQDKIKRNDVLNKTQYKYIFLNEGKEPINMSTERSR